MIEPGRYTSGRIAIANLSASIEALEQRRVEGASFDDLLALSQLLFLRGDLLGRIAGHDRAHHLVRGRHHAGERCDVYVGHDLLHFVTELRNCPGAPDLPPGS